tara:strand:+ start:257 stop:391 length:135 start_codon:yes stop_codon:yes gene_type:complete
VEVVEVLVVVDQVTMLQVQLKMEVLAVVEVLVLDHQLFLGCQLL